MATAMRRARGLAVLAVLALTPPAARAQVFTQADKKAILVAHNRARCAVSPTAQAMPALVWNMALETTAQNWASSCVDNVAPTGLIDHNPDRSVGHPYYVGENIYGSSGTASPTQAVSSWVGERVNYSLATNTCAATKVCGHYTQVVWANTLEVGCARALCSGLLYGSGIVCDYGPGGNWSGQWPYVSGSGVNAACDLIFDDGFEPPVL
jgi:pathogenesis-related protein 1